MEKEPNFKTPTQEKLSENPVELANEIIRLRRELKLSQEALKRSQEISFHDQPTGLLNINYYEQYKNEYFNADKDRNKIALVYCDINNLKQTNDTLGHKAGDQLIVDTAEFLKDQFRKEDVIIRLYGDEFVVICRDRKEGISYEKLTDRLEAILDSASNLNNPISIALGMAVFDNQERDGKIDTDLNDTETRAEQEMYRVKSEMKDQK